MTSNLAIDPAPATRRPACLVTGAAGFIGTRMCTRLAQLGHGLRRGDKSGACPELGAQASAFDFTEPGAWAAFLSGATRHDAVVHLAGRLGVRNVVGNPEECRHQNTAMARALVTVLAQVPEEERPRVFAASTSEVYLPARRKLREDDPLRPVDGRGRWTYAASKLESERRIDLALARDPLAAPVHLRFFNVVGPGQDSAQGMVLPTFVEHALAGRPIPVHGDGSSVRTLAHVDDVAETLCALVTHSALPGGPLNVGGIARASVLEIAECVLALSHSRAGIVRVDPTVTIGATFEDVDWREPDLARLRSLGVPVPSRSLEEIVADTLERHADVLSRRNACASRGS